MIETILKIDGMACGMCESHINDVVRRTCSVKKVTSSHTRGETVILSEQPVDEAALRAAIKDTGYEVKEVSSAPYEKKGLFGACSSADVLLRRRARCAIILCIEEKTPVPPQRHGGLTTIEEGLP